MYVTVSGVFSLAEIAAEWPSITLSNAMLKPRLGS